MRPKGTLINTEALIAVDTPLRIMKFGRLAKVVLVSAVILWLLSWVSQDQAARVVYAAREGNDFVLARSILVLSSTLSGRAGPLTSPLTLDWAQVIIVALAIIDAVYIYGFLKSKSPPG